MRLIAPYGIVDKKYLYVLKEKMEIYTNLINK